MTKERKNPTKQDLAHYNDCSCIGEIKATYQEEDLCCSCMVLAACHAAIAKNQLKQAMIVVRRCNFYVPSPSLSMVKNAPEA